MNFINDIYIALSALFYLQVMSNSIRFYKEKTKIAPSVRVYISLVRAEKSVKGKILEKEVNVSPQLLPNEEDWVGGGEGGGGDALLRPGNSAINLQKHSAERLKRLCIIRWII
jgi:hypothetical protein